MEIQMGNFQFVPFAARKLAPVQKLYDNKDGDIKRGSNFSWSILWCQSWIIIIIVGSLLHCLLMDILARAWDRVLIYNIKRD